MIAFTPRFQALALALLMVVDAAPIPSTSTTSSASVASASATPLVKPQYINRLPVFVSHIQAAAEVLPTSSVSMKSRSATASKTAKLAKASAPVRRVVSRAAMKSSSQPPMPSQTAQGITVNVPPVNVAVDSVNPLDLDVNIGARDPHHHHHDDHHREKIVVNGDHDHVEARSPHHHHHDHHGYHGEKVVINGDHDTVDLHDLHHDSRRDNAYHSDEPEVVVHGHDDHVETGDRKHVDTRRAIWMRDNAVPGTIQLVNGSSVAIASLVVDQSNSSSPVLAASEQNSTQVRLVFVSPDDFSAAGMNGSSLKESEVPVQMQIEAFNPISAVTGVVGGVLQSLCATLGAVDALLALLGLELCPHQASAQSLFAFDTSTGALRPFSGGQIVMGTNGTAGTKSMSVKDMHGNATAPNPAMTLIFTPSAIELQLDLAGQANSTKPDASAQEVSQEDVESSSVSAKAVSTKSSSSSTPTSTPMRRRFTKDY